MAVWSVTTLTQALRTTPVSPVTDFTFVTPVGFASGIATGRPLDSGKVRQSVP